MKTLMALAAALALVSDIVINNLIDTAGKVLVAFIPTLAVLWSGRKTRKRMDVTDRQLDRKFDDIHSALGKLKPDNAPPSALPAMLDRDVSQTPAHDTHDEDPPDPLHRDTRTRRHD